MKICHVITRLIIGGAQENTVLTCRGLAERGHDVTLISGPETGPEGSLWSQARDAGCALITLDSLRRNVAPLRDLRALRALRDIFQETQPDVVHTHSSKAGILGRTAAAQACVPTIVHTIHGMSFNRTQSLLKRMVYRLLERRAARHTTAFVSVADAMTEQAVLAGLAPRDRFVTIRSGMETDRFSPNADTRARVRAAWGAGEGDVVVGTIARLFANKGYEEIIESMPRAVAAQPNLKYVWVGDGANRRTYESQLQRLGLQDRVHFTGLVSPEQVGELLTGFDIVLHASRWEGLPRAIVQGLLTEVPAVSFDNDGAPEVVIANETGVLVPLRDVSALANAVASLASDPDRRKRLGHRGRVLCRDQFDWRRMVDELESLYGRLP